MGRQIVPLTVERLPLLVDPCSTCVFWERSPAESSRPASDPLAVKQDWMRRVLQDWGSPGRVALVDRTPAGYVTYAPAHLVPRAMAFPTAPVSEDAIALVTARITGEYAGQGLGRTLVQRAAKDALRRGVRAIEVFATTAPHRSRRTASGTVTAPPWRRLHNPAAPGGSQDGRDEISSSSHTSAHDGDLQVSVAPGQQQAQRRALGDPLRHGPALRPPSPQSPSALREEGHQVSGIRALHHCLLPVDFLTAVGFHPVREHPLYPRMRLDLRTALRWREELELAVERLFIPVRSVGSRRPVGSVN